MKRKTIMTSVGDSDLTLALHVVARGFGKNLPATLVLALRSASSVKNRIFVVALNSNV